jgi:tetratricopeptide (TPR) repeat protein
MNFLKRDFIIREPLLVSILVLITVAFSALTHAYSQACDRRRATLGIEWFERGKVELNNKRPSVAVQDFRTALLYDPRNWNFGLYLAGALTTAGDTEQALNYYQGLWQVSPNNGPVNLQMARLAAQKGDSIGSERYFTGAIFGDWPENAEANRRAASLELINFYLDRKDFGRAESQLIILSDNLPEDPQLHTRVAELFARVGDDQRAMDQYRRAIQLDPNDVVAMHGAGEASFRLGQYHAAQAYLNRVLHLNASDAATKQLLAVIQSVLQLNPYEYGITESEKIKRTLRTFEIAGKRLQACSGPGHASVASSIEPFNERWKQLQPTADSRFLSHHPEETDTLLDFSAAAEKTAEANCGELSPDDSAVLAIASQHGEKEQ